MKRTLLSSGTPWKPRELFEYAETSACSIKRLIREFDAGSDFRYSASCDDVFATALLVEDLARYGKTQTAADAIDVAERVEHLLELLSAKVNCVLASQH